MYSKKVKVPFFYADAAGILFFSRVGEIFHSVYEAWWSEFGPWEETFQSKELAIPIKKWEVTYMKPVFAGSELECELSVQKIGNTSFQLSFSANFEKEVVFEALSSHVFIDPVKKGLLSIPSSRKEFLENYQS